MAKKITKDYDEAEELVQDFYLMIANKDAKNKIVLWNDNYHSYIQTALRNLHSDKKQQKYREQQVLGVIPFSDVLRSPSTSFIDIYQNNETDEEMVFELNDMEDPSTEDMISKREFEEFYEKIEDFLENKYKGVTRNFKVGLLKLNTLEGMSMRDISEATGITKRVVQKSIEGVRKIIREQYEKDYLEYKIK